MRDSICPRCGACSSATGVSIEIAREIAASHVCVDGVATVGGDTVVRVVLGPGERTLDDERTRL